jgi:hypothetical protein
LLFNSIRRVQDREWVLQELGSLETVLAPGSNLDTFISETDTDDRAQEVLRLVDGNKTVKQIGSVSALGEFEVCKVLAGAELLGALQRRAEEAAPEPEPGGAQQEEVLFVSEDHAVPESAPEGLEQTILDTEGPPYGAVGEPAAPGVSLPPTPFEEPPPPPPFESDVASDLLIDEPESELGGEVPMGRIPPRPRGRGSDTSGNLKKILIAVAAVVLLAGGGYAGYTFLWPLITGSGGDTSKGTDKGPTTAAQKGQPQGKEPAQKAPSGPTAKGDTTSQPQPGATPPVGPTTQPGQKAAAGQTPTPGQPTGQAPPPTTKDPKAPSPGTSAGQKAPSPQPKQATTTSPPKQPPAPKPGTSPGASTPIPPSSLSRSYELLKSGNLRDAAAGYLQHLRSNAPDNFTIAVGVFCDSSNVSRVFKNSGNSDRLIVLPYRYQGRSCYRVFWGLFDSREAAARGVSSVPAAIRAAESALVPTSKLIR